MADDNKTALVKTNGDEAPRKPLPGELDVDAKLVDAAVGHINELYVRKGMETALEIGKYIADTFFGGDTELTVTGDSASFRKLAEREDLEMSHSWLWSATRVYRQWDLIPEGVREKLSFSHHRALLPLGDDTKALVTVAKKAVKEGLTKIQLDALVAEHRETSEGDPRGRPPEPAFIGSLKKLNKAAEIAKIERDLQAILSRFSPKGRASLKKKAQKEYKKAETSLTKLTTYLADVKAKIDAM